MLDPELILEEHRVVNTEPTAKLPIERKTSHSKL